MLSAGYVAVGYIFLSLSGIALNVFVLWRLGILAKRKPVLFMTGCGLPLAAMTAADLLSLFSTVGSIFFPLFVAVFDPSNVVKDWQCKLLLFTLHTMTTVSIWCWLFATLMRYTAVYHPQMHLTRWRLGCKSLLVVVLISAVMNSWVPVTTASGEDYCYQRPLFGEIGINNLLLFVDIIWSYVLPVAITVILDIRVMLRPPPGLESSRLETSRNNSKADTSVIFTEERPKSQMQSKIMKFLRKKKYSIEQSEKSDNSTSINKNDQLTATDDQKRLIASSSPRNSKSGPVSRSARARSSIANWLLITTIKLLIITPDSVLRLVTFFCACTLATDPSSFMHLVVVIARMLYFVQFWSNAAYLTTVIKSGDVKMRREREQELANGNIQSVNNNPNNDPPTLFPAPVK